MRGRTPKRFILGRLGDYVVTGRELSEWDGLGDQRSLWGPFLLSFSLTLPFGSYQHVCSALRIFLGWILMMEVGLGYLAR